MKTKFEPDARKFRRFKFGNTRDSKIVAHISTTASFGEEIRIEKVGGDRKLVAVCMLVLVALLAMFSCKLLSSSYNKLCK